MAESLRKRIEGRLEALGINPFEADRRAGLKRGYTNDLLIGKKSTMRRKALTQLSGTLECDLEFLTLEQATPRRGEAALPLSGIVEAGVWREPGAAGELPAANLPIPIDPRYSPNEIRAYLVNGDHAAGIGITGGSVITVLVSETVARDGDFVLAQREKDGLVELSVRVLRAGALGARPAQGITIADIPLSEAKILGLLVNSIRVFGSPN